MKTSVLCLLFSGIISFIFVACGEKIYHLKCDETVPEELAETIESKVYVEGDNPLFGESYSRVLVTIQDGKIIGLKHKTGNKVLALISGGGAPTPPTKCETDFVACTAGCGPAPLDGNSSSERDNCLETCQLKFDLCKCQNGALMNNISIM